MIKLSHTLMRANARHEPKTGGGHGLASIFFKGMKMALPFLSGLAFGAVSGAVEGAIGKEVGRIIRDIIPMGAELWLRPWCRGKLEITQRDGCLCIKGHGISLTPQVTGGTTGG